MTRPFAVVAGALVVTGALAGCSTPDVLPQDADWPDKVVAAMSTTSGVEQADLKVNFVDSGLGHTGPVILGTVHVAADAARATLDAMVGNMCTILGPDTSGIRWTVSVVEGTNRGTRMQEFGYAESASEACAGG